MRAGNSMVFVKCSCPDFTNAHDRALLLVQGNFSQPCQQTQNISLHICCCQLTQCSVETVLNMPLSLIISLSIVFLILLVLLVILLIKYISMRKKQSTTRIDTNENIQLSSEEYFAQSKEENVSEMGQNEDSGHTDPKVVMGQNRYQLPVQNDIRECISGRTRSVNSSTKDNVENKALFGKKSDTRKVSGEFNNILRNNGHDSNEKDETQSVRMQRKDILVRRSTSSPKSDKSNNLYRYRKSPISMCSSDSYESAKSHISKSNIEEKQPSHTWVLTEASVKLQENFSQMIRSQKDHDIPDYAENSQPGEHSKQNISLYQGYQIQASENVDFTNKGPVNVNKTRATTQLFVQKGNFSINIINTKNPNDESF